MPWNATIMMRKIRLVLCVVMPVLAAAFLRTPVHLRRTNDILLVPLSVRLPSKIGMATSSSDVKKFNQRNKKRDVKTVAARLAKAAKEANQATEAKAKEKKKSANASTKSRTPKMKEKKNEDNDEGNLKSISDLSKIIDEELLRPRDGYRPPRETSSMKTLLEHNDKTARSMVPDDKSPSKTQECRNVAMVFSKPLWKDQITTEYASRLVLLGQMMKYDEYQPSLICFCGSNNPRRGNMVAETSAGVLFFRHLCVSNNISLDGVDLCIVDHDDATDTNWSSSRSLRPIVEELVRRRHLSNWLEQSKVYESVTDEYGMTREEPRKKIHVHFALISTDYHLCNLNDIHVRSSRQSPLNTMLHELEQSIRGYRGLAKITWRFKYAAYPYLDSGSDLTTFLGKCYKLAQDLRPLLVNIRGVANQDEFFQRDNYRVLVATRGALVTLLEEMNEAYRHNKQRKTTTGLVSPELKAQLQKTIIPESTLLSSSSRGPERGKFSGEISVDVALESALLSLGRCADIVRPAGRLTSQSVSQEEWADAMHQLEHFLDLMQRACDPDRPLPAKQWGELTNYDSSLSTTEIMPTFVEGESSGGLDGINELDEEPEDIIDLAALFDGDIGMVDSME